MAITHVSPQAESYRVEHNGVEVFVEIGERYMVLDTPNMVRGAGFVFKTEELTREKVALWANVVGALAQAVKILDANLYKYEDK